MTKKTVKKSKPKSGYFVGISLPGVFEAAIEYQDKGEFQLAIDMLEVLVRFEPEKIEPKFRLGCCYCELGRYTEAIVQLEEVVKERPKIANGWETLGKVCYAAGHTVSALSHVDRAVALNPDDNSARILRAVILRRSGDDVAAIKQLRVAASNPNDDGSALYLLANTLARLPFRSGQNEAVLHFSSVCKNWPGTQCAALAAIELIEINSAGHAEHV